MKELIIIRTENSQELKEFLTKKRMEYETYPYGKIMTDQVHSFDKKKRLVRKVGILPKEILEKVEETLQELLDLGKEFKRND